MNHNTLSQPDLDTRAFERIRYLAESLAGLSIPDNKRKMIQSRVTGRLKATGHLEFSSYLDYIEREADSCETQKFISCLTTNVSHFFREEHHFKLIEHEVKERLLARAQSGEKIRMWSAGCSTGQEPYSLAMTLLETSPNIRELDIKILATDIDEGVLLKAVTGIYPATALGGITQDLQTKYFKPDDKDGNVLVKDKLRDLIIFRKLNLIDEWPMKGQFDVIFCRNVVIYFSDNTQEALWHRFSKKMRSNGLLLLGHSERIQKPEEYSLRVAGVTSYRKTSNSDSGRK